MGLPSLTATGNLTADPELRFTASGAAVASFTVACNKRVKTEAGGWKDSAVCFLACSIWERKAEAVAEELVKGDEVTVVGALKQREWEDRDGNKRTSFEVDAFSVAKVVKARTADRERPSEPTTDPWATGGQGQPQNDPWAAQPASDTTPPF